MLSDYNGPSGGVLKANYVYANGERVAKFKQTDGDVRYYLSDHLGSAVGTVDRFGSLKNWSQFRPFGAVHNELVIDEERMGFTGQERETELGHDWTYHGARYYDTKLRIFTQVDPQMERYPGWSPYTYTLDNPVKNVDPDGEIVVAAAVIAAILLLEANTANAPGFVFKTNATGIPVNTEPGRTVGDDVRTAALIGVLNVAGRLAVQKFATAGATADATAVASKTSVPKEGIYQVKAASGKPYVGQSSNIPRRLKQQIRSGKTTTKNAARAGTKEVKGGKTVREVAEQKRIDELGGIKNLENQVNPIGKTRKHLIEEVE